VSELRIAGLEAGVAGRQILFGIDLEAESGEVHAVMGPNGSGKSTLGHVLMGHPAYKVLAGSVTLDGVELLGLTTAERARAGLFLAPQYPIEVPGVALESALGEALAALGRPGEAATDELAAKLAAEADAIGFDRGFLERPMNVDLSGGERKRNETVQLAVLRPRFAVLDEIDSGLDVDALRAVARRIERETGDGGDNGGGGGGGQRLGVLAITHYSRLLRELRPDVVHVMTGGRIVATGGPELADELERTGYDSYASV
jgi:Fe-S cluster assembly ATP-binding protein